MERLFRHNQDYFLQRFSEENRWSDSCYFTYQGNNSKTIRMGLEMLSYYCDGRKDVMVYADFTSPETKGWKRWTIREVIPDFDVFETFLNDTEKFLKENPNYFLETFGKEFAKPVKFFWKNNRAWWFRYGQYVRRPKKSLIQKLANSDSEPVEKFLGFQIQFKREQITGASLSTSQFSFVLNQTRFIFHAAEDILFTIEPNFDRFI